jgi:ketosteroid isomerase-like protein
MTTVPAESGALENQYVRAIRDYQAAMARGDTANAIKVFAPDVTYTVPGHNRLSRNYQGPEQVMGYFQRLMELTNGSYHITQMIWLVNDNEQVVLETVNVAEIANHTLTWNEAILFTFKNGKKQSITLFQADQQAVDAFFG